MKRTSINIVLIIFAFFLFLMIVTSLSSELCFNHLNNPGLKGHDQKIILLFEHAIKMDKLNSEYAAALGNFLFDSIKDGGGKEKRNKIQELYKAASRLNPYHADYYIKLAQIQITIFFESKKNGECLNSLKALAYEAISNLRYAVKSDPNGFNVSYSAGYAGLSLWKYLSEKDRSFVLDRLFFSLKLKPWYGSYMYPKLWTCEHNFYLLKKITPDTLTANKVLYNFVISRNLWQFRDEQIRSVQRLRIKEDRTTYYKEKAVELKRLNEVKEKFIVSSHVSSSISEDRWNGISTDGVNTIKNGLMFWNGTMDAVIKIREGEASLKIKARGDPANGIYPYMTVNLNGDYIGGAYVASGDWNDYKFSVKTGGGIKVLSISFVNDGASKDGKEDRNLYIGRAEAI